MGTTKSKIIIENQTRSRAIATCGDTDDFDWDGRNGDPKYIFEDGVEIKPKGTEEKRVELMKVASNCPYAMTLKFNDESKDEFKINQKWAHYSADFGLQRSNCDHVLKFIRDWESRDELKIVIKNTAYQDLAFDCEVTLKKCEEDYETEPLETEEKVSKLLENLEKILHLECCKDKEVEELHKHVKDTLAERIAKPLWNRTNILMAKIQKKLSEDYKQKSIECENDEERGESWRFFERSKEFLNEAIKLCDKGHDPTLKKRFEKFLPNYDKKQQCNKMINDVLPEVEKLWNEMYLFHGADKIIVDPVIQSKAYLIKYRYTVKACDKHQKVVGLLKNVEKEMKVLVEMDKDYLYCLKFVTEILDLLKPIYPTLKKIQLQTALKTLKFSKSDQQSFLWNGEEYVEIKSPAC